LQCYRRVTSGDQCAEPDEGSEDGIAAVMAGRLMIRLTCPAMRLGTADPVYEMA
jgi:hypothetical protein